MEQQFNNAINFAIGCARVISEKYHGISETIRNGVSDLISEGKNSRNDISMQIRETVRKATNLFSRSDKKQKTDVA